MNNAIIKILIPLLLDQSQKNLTRAREIREPMGAGHHELYTAHMTACVMWSDYADLLMELEKKL